MPERPPPPFTGAWPAVPDSVPTARRAAVAYLRTFETTDPPLSDIGIVVSEALTNAVVHGYAGDEPGEVRLTVTLTDDEVQVTVEDDGRGLLPRLDSPGLGLGLPLIATLAESLELGRSDDDRTEVRMTFRLEHAGEAA